ncbi:MAG: ABC transporter substrate-binding protein [Candidatus Electrothrix sp. AW5]|nr:ABC transporter substrate-binding protein [Candidatus Electrothrix gigas]
MILAMILALILPMLPMLLTQENKMITMPLHPNPKARILLLACLFFLTSLTTVCKVQADPLPVFVSIAPQKWLVEQIGGDLVSTNVLLDKGQEPHTYQPSPEKIASLFRSRLYFTIGMPFEEHIAQKITNRKGRKATGVQLIDITTGIHKLAMNTHDHDHHRPALAQEHADPHVWLDPRNGEKMASVITEALTATDPTHAATYQQNYTKLKERLARLHQDLKQQLTPLQGATFFVFHPAFGYLAHAYHLQQQAVEIEGKSPSPKQLYTLVRQAKKKNVKVLFVQPQFDKKNASIVARAIQGQLVELNPLREDIEQNLREMAKAMQTALAPIPQ